MAPEEAEKDLEEFNADRWVRQLSDLAKDPIQLDTVEFIAMLRETTNLFKKMGSAMSVAFSGKIFCLFTFRLDITKKAANIRKNQLFYQEKF